MSAKMRGKTASTNYIYLQKLIFFVLLNQGNLNGAGCTVNTTSFCTPHAYPYSMKIHFGIMSEPRHFVLTTDLLQNLCVYIVN